MASSIILRNMKQLEQSLQKNIDYIDFNYNGVKNKSAAGFKLAGASPVLNAFKIWLQSKSTDYIRNAGRGGFFNEEIFRYPFNASSEEPIAKAIIALAAQEFPTVQIIDLEVKCMAPKKYWKVKVAVQDKLTNMVSFDMHLEDSAIIMDA